MALVHKSVDIRIEVWRRLRINAELSGVSLRDYLSYLIEANGPVDPRDGHTAELLHEVISSNQAARDAQRVAETQLSAPEA